MKTNIQFVHSDPSLSVEQLVQRKLDKLETKYDFIIGADVQFKVENDNTGKGQICAIRLSLPGPLIHASANAETFEAAAVETVNELERQLRKRKEEMRSR